MKKLKNYLLLFILCIISCIVLSSCLIKAKIFFDSNNKIVIEVSPENVRDMSIVNDDN